MKLLRLFLAATVLLLPACGVMSWLTGTGDAPPATTSPAEGDSDEGVVGNQSELEDALATGDPTVLRNLLAMWGVPPLVVMLIMGLFMIPRTRGPMMAIVGQIMGILRSAGVLVGARHSNAASKAAAEDTTK